MESNLAVRTLAALAQETRLAVFRTLVQAGPEGLPAGRIAGVLEVPLPTLSFHLKELVNAGLVSAQPVSRFVIYRADYARMEALVAYLGEKCCRGVPDAALPASCETSCAPSPERNVS